MLCDQQHNIIGTPEIKNVNLSKYFSNRLCKYLNDFYDKHKYSLFLNVYIIIITGMMNILDYDVIQHSIRFGWGVSKKLIISLLKAMYLHHAVKISQIHYSL